MNLKRLKRLLTDTKSFEKRVTGDFKETFSTWESDKPVLRSSSEFGNDIVVKVFVFGDSKGTKKWIWLNGGTRVRYATMSQDWKSKTKPGVLKSGRGRGKVLYVNRRRPRPGIHAREWTLIIFKSRSPEFKNIIENNNQSGLKVLYG